MESEKKMMDQETRMIAYRIHKDYFDRCKSAIELGFHFEALCLEYAAIEGRVAVIMSLLSLPCSKCSVDTYKKLSLNNKLICLKKALECKEVFEKTALTKKKIDAIQKWCNRRNEIIHNLYIDPTSTDELISSAKKYTERGYEYSKWLYNECNRLKRMNKKDKSILANAPVSCRNPRGFCVYACQEIGLNPEDYIEAIENKK